MRRTVASLFTLLLALMLGSSVVLAASAHFVGRVSSKDLGTQLQVSGSIAGLGNDNIDIQVTAQGLASVTCTNPGGNVAPGQNTSVTASGSATDLRTKNGRASFTVTTAAPTANGAFVNGVMVCPNEQWTAAITDVTFSSFSVNVYQPATKPPFGGTLVLSQTFNV